MRRILLTSIFICILCSSTYGQKKIAVSSSEPYMEWLGGTPDLDSHDLCFRLVYDETTNSLTASLSSSNSNLFAFHSGGIVYKNFFKNGRKLMVERLPYKIVYEPSNKFILSKHSKKALGPGSKEAIFHSWIESDGLMPVQTEITMPEDSLVQTFKVNSDDTEIKVTLRLRDIFFLEHNGSSPLKWNRYYLTNYQDLQKEYDIRVLRNPCFGKGEQIESVKARHKEASEAISMLEKKFPEGKVFSLEEYEEFQSIRNGILLNFTKSDEKTDCPELKSAIESYNGCIDSLLNMSCSISDEKRMELVRNLGIGLQRIDAEWLYHCARQIDELTAQWSVEKKKSMKLSIKMQCEKIIEDVTASTAKCGMLNDDDRKALRSFIQAKQYFYNTCK